MEKYVAQKLRKNEFYKSFAKKPDTLIVLNFTT